MKTCTFCHWEGPDDSMFCGQCGRRLINPGDTFTGSSDTRISGSHAPDDTGTFIGENTPFKLSDSGEKTEEELEHEILHPFDDIDSEQTIKAIHDTKKEEEEDEDRLIPLPPMWGSNRVQPADNILAQDALHIDQVPEGNIPHIPGQPPPMASPPVSQAAQVFQVSPPPSQATAPPHPWYSQGHPHPPHPHRPPIQRHIRPTCLIVVIVAFIVASTIIAIITFFLKPTPPPPNPTAQLVGKPIPGLSMILRGSRFVPAETVTIVIDNKPVASNGSYPSNSMSMGRIFLQKASQAPPAGAKKTVSEDGTFSHTILVDLRWPVGSSHTVYVYRQDGTFIQLPPFTVYMPSVRTGLLGCLNEAAPITLGPISEGSIQPVSKTITLCTQGSGSVNWTATWDQKWLQLPSSGQIQAPQQGNLTLTGSANGLAPGAYTTTVVFSSRQSLTSVPLSVVLAVVKAGTSQIPTQKKGVECVSASPRSISFANVADAAAALSKSVTVNNCGDAGAWSASVSTSDGKQWLGISPSGDKLQSGGLQDVGITTSSANLSPGKYTGQVTFQIGSSSANVQVTFTVWPPQPPPCISASSQSLTFVSIAGQSTPPSQAIKLINCGAAGQWSLSAVTDDGKDWAQFNPSSHALKEREVQQVNVSVSSAQLEKGTYTGKIIVSMGSSSATVNITFIVEGSCLQIDYSSLLFKSTVGKGALEDPVTITNCGYPDSWYASASTDDGADWLTITRTYDQLPAKASQRIGVIASGAQLHKGTYTGHILFIMGGSTATVRVTLIIAGTPPCISTNMDLLEFTSFQGENPDPQVVTVGNCGSAEGSWISSVNGTPWIRTDLSRGGLKSMDVQDIRVSLSSKQLPVGTYRGGITFSMGPNSKDVQILLTVQPPPPHVCITPDPSSLEFSSTIVDGKVSSPKAQAVQITNCGDSGTLSVSAVTNDGAPWLGVNLPTENLNAGETSNVPVAVDSTNLGNGTYTATIRFTITTSTGGTGVVNVRVILTVSQITSICTANPSTLTFTSTWGEPSPEAQNSILTNCGANDTWEESDYSGELFHVGPHLGTLDNNGSQVVSVSPGSYTPDPGKHTYTLTFTTGAGKRASVETTWIILPPPNPTCIQADPSSINFSDHYTNTLAPVSFTNCGALPGNVTVTGTTSEGTNWLIINSHDPIDGSGSYSTRYGPSISVRIDPTNLEPGPHYGSVTASIKTSQGSNSVTVGVTFTVPAPPPPPTPTPVPIATSGVTPTDTSTPGVTPTDTSTPTPPSPTPPSPSPTNTPPAPPTETPTPTPAPPSPTPTPPPAPPTETPTPTPTPPPAPPTETPTPTPAPPPPTPTPPPAPPTETPTPTPAPPPPTPTPPPAPPPPTPTSTQTNPQSFSLPPGFAYTDMDNRRHLLMVEHSHHRILDVNGDS